MIAKMSAGNTLYGVLAYNQTKVDDGQAEVIFTNRMIEPRDGEHDIHTCLRSFEPYLLANLNTEKPVLHVSLNPDPEDKLDDGQLSGIAEEYMREMGYGDQPFIVYKHEDTGRKHIHIVSLRVDGEGKKINDRFEHRRSMDVCRALEQKHGLIPAVQKKRPEGLPLKPVRYDDGDVKRQIAGVVRQVAGSWHFQSLKEYRALLALYNISVEEVRGEVKGKPYRGLLYSALDGKGEKAGTPFKSSLFGKSAGIVALEERFEKSAAVIKEKGLKGRVKEVVADAIRATGGRAGFERALEKEGISVIFRTNEEGRIYGATFVDHQQECVFNGSRLGKEFSANVFNALFNGMDDHHIQTGASKPDGKQDFDPVDGPFREKDGGDSLLGGLFGIFTSGTPDDGADNAEERAFIHRLKKKRKRRRHL